jgi:hypothetical protein
VLARAGELAAPPVTTASAARRLALLRSLELGANPVTPAGVKRLAAALPRCVTMR